MKKSVVLLWLMVLSFLGRSQMDTVRPFPLIAFENTNNKSVGFDDYFFPRWNLLHPIAQPVNAHISLQPNTSSVIHFNLLTSNLSGDSVEVNALSEWKFRALGPDVDLYPTARTNGGYSMLLPAYATDYFIEAYYRGEVAGRLAIHVYPVQTVRVIVVPHKQVYISRYFLERYLNSVYSQAQIRFEIELQEPFKPDTLDWTGKWSNPSSERNRYTNQMKLYRDEYLKKNPTVAKDAYYLFLMPGFNDTARLGYMPRNKACGFIKYIKGEELYPRIARELAFGVGGLYDSWQAQGPEIGTTENLLDTTGGAKLVHWQWDYLQRNASYASVYDEDENLITNNGLVAYYLWEEDENNWMIVDSLNPLKSIKRPFKKNYSTYHRNLQDSLLDPLFFIGTIGVCYWHFISLGLIFLLWLLARAWVLRMIRNSDYFNRFWKRPMIFLVTVSVFAMCYGSYAVINWQLEKYDVRGGVIQVFQGLESSGVQRILENPRFKRYEEQNLESQILVKRGEDWYYKSRKRVLYFEVKKDTNGNYVSCRFNHHSDSLILYKPQFAALAESHYFVFSYIGDSGAYVKQRVFNHKGIEVTDKMTLEDPAKRILLFVNGYRPTSMGSNFEEYFSDIRNNGLEHSNSNNQINEEDFYNYWKPWKGIDGLFKKRLNPSKSYYADGHHSVTTSNHRSLLNFTSKSKVYPKRCQNLKKHTCFHTKLTTTGFFGGTEWKPTLELLATEANEEGFETRRSNGRIAGKNLLMMLNEYPNRGFNDTLYIVAHSMGYAYALGIADELRGKISFGGFYIVAAENAQSGELNLAEWQEVWQYGTDLFGKYPDAPCLQDGVAPQSLAKNLPVDYWVRFPRDLNRFKGYFDSHFIGYYTWIFNIEKNRKGYIRQR